MIDQQRMFIQVAKRDYRKVRVREIIEIQKMLGTIPANIAEGLVDGPTSASEQRVTKDVHPSGRNDKLTI